MRGDAQRLARPPGQQEGQHAACRPPVRQVQPGAVPQRRPAIAGDQQHQPPLPAEPGERREQPRRQVARQHRRARRQPRRQRPRIGQPVGIAQQPKRRDPRLPLEAPGRAD